MAKFIYSRQDVQRENALISYAAQYSPRTVYMVVPEQLSMQREFSVSMKQKNIRVMTFSTLTEEIFRTLGGACKRTPDSAAVTAAINLAVINTYSKLGYYKSVALGSGFALKLSEAFTQFDINRLSADSLKKIPDTEISPSIRRKYADLFTIYEEYKNICKSDYILQGDSLVKAAGIIELEPFFENTPVIFDGFHGFTHAQLTFIEQVLLSAPDCVFSMTTDLESEVFSAVNLEIDKIRKICKKHGIPTYFDKVTDPKRINNAELCHLERNLFEPVLKPDTEFENTDRITIYAASNLNDELSYIACKIKNDVLDGKYRYKDIAVLVPDFDKISTVAAAVFDKYGVPVFIDVKRALASKPLFAFVMSALEIAEDGFEFESVFTLAKTGLAGINNDDVSLLENYVRKWKIRKSGWNAQPWTASPSGVDRRDPEQDAIILEKINALKDRLFLPLDAFCKKIRALSTLTEYLRAVCELLESFDVKTALVGISERFIQNGDPETADEYTRIYDVFMTLLDSIHAVMGNGKMTVSRFSDILSSCAGSVAVSQRPARIDEVTFAKVGSVRSEFAKCVYIPCLNNGAYPSAPPSASLITESDKRLFIKYGIPVPMDKVGYSLRERFNMYSAAFCATDELVFTYSMFTVTGEKREPSIIIDDIKKVTGILEKQRSDLEPEFFMNTVASVNELASEGKYKGLDEVLYELTGIKPVQSVTDDTRLADSIVEKMYNRNLRLSFSGIESFVECPFSFFLERGLRISKDEPVEFEPANAGTFIHKGLELLLGDGYDIKNSTDEKVLEIADGIIDDYYNTELCDCKGRSPRFDYLFSKAGAAFKSAALNIAKEVRDSDFVPFDFEIEISDYVKPAVLKSGYTLSLVGSIDRVDTFENYARVVDYKSGKQTFSLDKIYNGISMQLPIYSAAVRSKYPELKLAAMYYLKVGTPKVTLKGTEPLSDERYNELVNDCYVRDGIFTDDRRVLDAMKIDIKSNSEKQSKRLAGNLDGLIDYTISKVHGIGDSISSGDVSASPIFDGDIKACEYCDFNSVCKACDRPVSRRKLEKPPENWLKEEC